MVPRKLHQPSRFRQSYQHFLGTLVAGPAFQEENPSVRQGGFMDWLARDLRTSFRLLARDKAFSLTAALTLALCIGANTALFSVVHHVLLRPLQIGRASCRARAST